jgi:hypothetical protein
MHPDLWRRVARWLVAPLWYARWQALYFENAPKMASTLSDDQVQYLKKIVKSRSHRSEFLFVVVYVPIAATFLIPEQHMVLHVGLRKLLYYSLIAVWAVCFLVVHRVSTTYNIVLHYMSLLRRLEENRDEWRHMRLARWINFDLRRLAGFVARLPQVIGTSHPDVVAAAACRANYIRNLQVWVSLPEANTRDDLYDVLLDGLHCVLDRRWFDLTPTDLPSTSRITRLQRAGYLSLGFVLAAGAATLIIFGKQWGAAAQLGSTAAAVGAYLAFNSAGAIPGSLPQALDAAQRATQVGAG